MIVFQILFVTYCPVLIQQELHLLYIYISAVKKKIELISDLELDSGILSFWEYSSEIKIKDRIPYCFWESTLTKLMIEYIVPNRKLRLSYFQGEVFEFYNIFHLEFGFF